MQWYTSVRTLLLLHSLTFFNVCTMFTLLYLCICPICGKISAGTQDYLKFIVPIIILIIILLIKIVPILCRCVNMCWRNGLLLYFLRGPQIENAQGQGEGQGMHEKYGRPVTKRAPHVPRLTQTGFPPIREIRENFEDYFQPGKSRKNRGFSAKIRKTIFKSGNFCQNQFQTF